MAAFSFSLASLLARFGRPATVLSREQLSARVHRVDLGGPAWVGAVSAQRAGGTRAGEQGSTASTFSRAVGPLRGDAEIQPGAKLKIEVAPGVLRSYTPFGFDPEQGRFSMTFFDHGRLPGKGAAWGCGAEPGQTTRALGPKRSLALGTVTPWTVFLGDESTLGLWVALRDALPAQTHLAGAVELDRGDEDAIAALGLPLDPALRRSERGGALGAWLDGAAVPWEEATVYLSGDGATVRGLRAQLEALGVAGDRIRVKAYWGDRRKAS